MIEESTEYEITFDTIHEYVTEEYDEELLEEYKNLEIEVETSEGLLGYVNWEMQNGEEGVVNNPVGTPSIDDLTN